MTKYNHISLVAVVIATLFFAVSASAQQDGWVQTYSTMASNSIHVDSVSGAHQGSWYLKTNFNGVLGDTVIWTRSGFDTPFEGRLLIWSRAFNNDFITVIGCILHHGDSTIHDDGYVSAGDGSSWASGVLENWSGTLSRFDAISIVAYYHPLFQGGAAITDLDDFQVQIGGQWQPFYTAGDLGKIKGSLFDDANSNSSKDSGEVGLTGWVVNLSGPQSGTTTTDSLGNYSFPDLPRGTYYLTQELQPGWQQTYPVMNDTQTVVVGNDSLTCTADFGNLPTTAQIFHTMRQGWNLVSLPVRPADSSKTAVFPNAISAAFAYVPNSGYETRDILQPGLGYWIKYPSSQKVYITGDTVSNQMVDVEEGWNLLGAITSSISINQVASLPSGVTISAFFGYNGQYKEVDTLRPGCGYWVKVEQKAQLILNASPAMVASNRVRIVRTDELPPAAPGESGTSDKQQATSFALEQNYPNPFNPTTAIKFTVDSRQFTVLKVYNLLGQEVATLVEGMKEPGSYQVEWNATVFPSGIYFYRLQAGNYTATQKMLLMK